MVEIAVNIGLIGWDFNREFTTITEQCKESKTLVEAVAYYLNK